jgi:hypothetical protein
MGNLDAPHTIDPNTVYTIAAATRALAAAKNCLPREIRKKRLRASKRGGMYYILGMWILEWIRAGEIRRDDTKVSDQAGTAAPPVA